MWQLFYTPQLSSRFIVHPVRVALAAGAGNEPHVLAVD